MRHPSFALLVLCCIGTAAGFRAAHLALPVQQQSARCTPLQLCTTPPTRHGSNRVARARPWLAAAVVAGSVVAMPTRALASATSTGEHLHLGQKIALFFKRAPPAAFAITTRCSGVGPRRALRADAAGTGLPDWAVLLLISMAPAVELRGGVPVRRGCREPGPEPDPGPKHPWVRSAHLVAYGGKPAVVPGG